MFQPVKRLPGLVLHFLVVLCTHVSTSETEGGRTCANMRRVLAHVSQGRIDARLAQFTVTARVLTNQLQYA